MPSFGTKSNNQLRTVAWDLQRVFREVVRYYDCTVIEGHRNEADQNKYFLTGTTKIRWPDGAHNTYPSNAVDVAPWPIPENWGDLKKNVTLRNRDLSWKERVKFYQLAAIVLFVADQMGVKIRWGGDWDGDGNYRNNKFDDLVHYELITD